MRRPRKQRQASHSSQQQQQQQQQQPSAQQLWQRQSVRVEPSKGPFGSWAQADLLALPRFPGRDSFPMAKDLIDRFHEDDLDYRDLRIALFWLGFGLLEMPTRERPTMSLVPLCKDLASYEDTAVELGYSPSASVHARPVCLQPEPRQQDSDELGVCAVAAGPSSSSSSTAGSSSSSAEACRTTTL